MPYLLTCFAKLEMRYVDRKANSSKAFGNKVCQATVEKNSAVYLRLNLSRNFQRQQNQNVPFQFQREMTTRPCRLTQGMNCSAVPAVLGCP